MSEDRLERFKRDLEMAISTLFDWNSALKYTAAKDRQEVDSPPIASEPSVVVANECPFCGSTNIIAEIGDLTEENCRSEVFICCGDCYAQGPSLTRALSQTGWPTTIFPEVVSATLMWNSRSRFRDGISLNEQGRPEE